MYGRMTGMAERKGGARRAWTKGAVAQKGHARHAEPAVYHMNLRTHLSRSNGYRELWMFVESIFNYKFGKSL
jgi:hypothetical protein